MTTCARCKDRGWYGVRQTGVRAWRGGWRRELCECEHGSALRAQLAPIPQSARGIANHLFTSAAPLDPEEANPCPSSVSPA